MQLVPSIFIQLSFALLHLDATFVLILVPVDSGPPLANCNKCVRLFVALNSNTFGASNDPTQIISAFKR